MTHACTTDECGWYCWLEDGVPWRHVSVNHGDAGRVDGEGPCACEEHGS